MGILNFKKKAINTISEKQNEKLKDQIDSSGLNKLQSKSKMFLGQLNALVEFLKDDFPEEDYKEIIDSANILSGYVKIKMKNHGSKGK